MEFKSSGGAWSSFADAGSKQVMEVRYVTDDNVDGANMTSSYVTMPLTTVSANTIVGANLASNVITLPAGTYNIRAIFRCTGVNSSGSVKMRLWDDTTGTLLATNTGKANMNNLYFLVPFDTIISLAGPGALRFDGRTNSLSLSCAWADDFIDSYSETHTMVVINKI
jgi:hypothetical protein